MVKIKTKEMQCCAKHAQGGWQIVPTHELNQLTFI
jgi:hypothetical protein